MNQKMWLLVVAVIIVGIITDYQVKEMSMVTLKQYGGCFEREDCKITVKKGYCDVAYDCISGKCYASYKECPKPVELCYNNMDDDNDTLIDCKDNDCYKSIYCPCSRATYNYCARDTCYCSNGSPKWFVSSDDAWCQCA